MFFQRTLISLALMSASLGLSAQTVPADLELIDFCPACANLSSPLGIHQPPGSTLFFINEQAGALKVISPPATTFTTVLNFGGGGTAPPGGFTASGERGLLGLAFHPQFADNRFMFLSYTDGNGDTLVARYTVSNASPPVVDVSSRLVIFRTDQDFSNHNGGHITFGPDGFLYLGLGDGGSGNDPCSRAQSITPGDILNTASCTSDLPFTSTGGNPNSRALLGSMIRLDINATTPAGSNELCASNADGSANYAIPASNPFVGSALIAGACDEILQFGLRNPWRFTFDRGTGDLLIGDVGQSAREEITFRSNAQMSTAANFGWACREGFVSASGSCRAGSSTVNPVMDYDRNAGQSITGGYVYRGPIVQMRGVYFFADFSSSRIWRSTQTAPGVFGPQPNASNSLLTAASNISSFGEDNAGNLYVIGFSNGRIYRFNSASALDLIFQSGFEPQ